MTTINASFFCIVRELSAFTRHKKFHIAGAFIISVTVTFMRNIVNTDITSQGLHCIHSRYLNAAVGYVLGYIARADYWIEDVPFETPQKTFATVVAFVI